MQVSKTTQRWIRRVLPALCIWAAGITAAHAGGGQIKFSGAIMAPTCALAAYGVEQALRGQSRTTVSCTNSGGGRPGDTRTYQLNVSQLSSGMVDSRARTYFQGFATSQSGTLVATRTYE